jgi:hypothetical protein
VETDFPLTLDPALQRGSINRRLTGRFGDGQTQITLESFSQEVKLTKAAPESSNDCHF